MPIFNKTLQGGNLRAVVAVCCAFDPQGIPKNSPSLIQPPQDRVMVGWLVGWLVGCLDGWLVAWLLDWLVNRMVDMATITGYRRGVLKSCDSLILKK